MDIMNMTIGEAIRLLKERPDDPRLKLSIPLTEEALASLSEISRTVSATLAPTIRKLWEYVSGRALRPGTFAGDVFLVYRDGDVPALKRLVRSEYFKRGRLFSTERWNLTPLSRAFISYTQELERAPATAWRTLAMSAIFAAVRDLPGNTRLGDWYPCLRRRVRSHIERQLLDGRTSDEKSTESEELIGDLAVKAQKDMAWWDQTYDDPLDALEIDKQFQYEMGELVDMQLDVAVALSRLFEAEREAVQAPLDGETDADLARREGITEGAIRQRRLRGKAKLRRILANYEP